MIRLLFTGGTIAHLSGLLSVCVLTVPDSVWEGQSGSTLLCSQTEADLVYGIVTIFSHLERMLTTRYLM